MCTAQWTAENCTERKKQEKNNRKTSLEDTICEEHNIRCRVKGLIISIQDERPLSCIDSKECRNTIPLKTHSTAKIRLH